MSKISKRATVAGKISVCVAWGRRGIPTGAFESEDLLGHSENNFEGINLAFGYTYFFVADSIS